VALLSTPGLQKFTNVRCFGPDIVKDVLKAILPSVCFEAPFKVGISSLSLDEQRQTEGFLPVFWSYALSRPDFLRAIAEGPAVVRSTTGTILTLSKMSFLILHAHTTFSLTEPLAEILLVLGTLNILYMTISILHDANIDKSLGANIVDSQYISSDMVSSPVILEYVSIPNRQGVLQTIRNLFKADKRALNSKVELLSSDQKSQFLDFIGKQMLSFTLFNCMIILL
jgi:hypothetical protein